MDSKNGCVVLGFESRVKLELAHADAHSAGLAHGLGPNRPVFVPC